MDYKEKYEQALERARQFSEKPYLEDSAGIVEYIFPELKESEDERIRKALLRFHKSTIDIDGIKGGDILAWLEKQGEKKSIDDLTQQEAMDIAVAKCFEQGEQKPQRMVSAEAKETMYDKPAWSEEDERLRKEIVNYLECQKEEEPTRKDKINSWISWILKHSFSEWTKKEKEAWNKILDRIIDILDWAEEKGRISLSDCQDYSIMLKSLRPQNTWKPSDEQMKAIKWIIDGDNPENWSITLENLYQDLKKLREK